MVMVSVVMMIKGLLDLMIKSVKNFVDTIQGNAHIFFLSDTF